MRIRVFCLLFGKMAYSYLHKTERALKVQKTQLSSCQKNTFYPLSIFQCPTSLFFNWHLVFANKIRIK